METFTYLVLVDFSECSHNALHYATLLAKCAPGTITLLHVVDLDDLPDSDNPVVISFAIDRMFKNAERKMRSLREIISLDGLMVRQQIVMGNVRNQVMAQIKETNPNVVVIGRSTEKKLDSSSLVAFLSRNIHAPVLVVPQSHNPRIPTHAVLASALKPSRQTQLTPFLDIVKRVSNELTVLNIKSRYFSKSEDALNWIKTLNAIHGINAKLVSQSNAENEKGIADFVRANKIDLLCTDKDHQSIFARIINRNFLNRLADQVDVPVMVI